MAMLNNQMVYIIPNHTPWKHGHFSGSLWLQTIPITAGILHGTDFMQPEQMLHLQKSTYL